jgi:hypothetical protein
MHCRSVAAERNRIGKFQPPEAWRRRQELNSHALALIAQFAQIHDPAFHLFLRLRVRNHEQFAVIHFVLQHQQAAMRAHHQCFARFLELFPVMLASLRAYFQFSKDSCAAPRGRKFSCCAHATMFCGSSEPVNCPSARLYRIRNGASGVTCSFPEPGLTITNSVAVLINPILRTTL